MTMLCSPIMLAYLAFAAAAAAADLAGALLVATAHQKGLAPLRYFVAGGAGFMLAAAFVRMLPESVQVPHAFLVVLIGYFGVHLFEHTVAPHFHFGEEIHPEALLRPSAGYLALFGLGVHTLFDGVAIAGGQSPRAAIGAGALLGVLTLAGAVATSFLAGHHVPYALALSAGVTIYVAASDLIPEVNREGGPALGWTVFAGLVLFALADWLVSPLGAR